ncbi:allophanate hydrolase subunit 1 [Lutimaribacter sp. EGI FJ00015]|uniref:Allophanate hydrolase subunit 1 n=1 Tax=Lutimaribacter degradans TaxID=2945989 RepID=A0ACC6A013_9RHOB|nr:allophanate hydrolase subunit 1 [Lutimaribacter sp. EGI FJ00013]MCM2562949.1 allophanate hydrolase subunit 1 [Lutimaribacter sp. EGI FJ00013]MCO0614117.1 allophanate hydrolase subunit 1 [Lutimaribacter sp. EGI FJ00015]MCO0636094.1 allophanate hydrolase subunit 1 [Lutimaribacter sp. EGI FJ00014]
MTDWPQIRPAGLDGLLVSFGDRLSEPANRAALAFRAAVEGSGWPAVQECSTSLVSTYLRFDPLAETPQALHDDVQTLLTSRNWYDAALPDGRRLWRIPTVYGTEMAPQLDEAAQEAGLSARDAIEHLSQTRVRVQTIGFAPGQPYLGELPEAWNIPRQTALTDSVPVGALTVAIRQLVLFSVSTPTGWRHVGQTAMRLFRPESDTPFILRPGDEVLFPQVTPEELENMRTDADGGARAEVLE